MLRSTFSTTTMASSTTMPMASTMPNRVRVLSENPSAAMTAKEPMSETGIATIGMRAVRQLWRKTITDQHDEGRGLEQRLVDLVHALGDELRRVVDDLVFDPRREIRLELRPSCAMIWSAASSALVPGRWKIARATAGLPFR